MAGPAQRTEMIIGSTGRTTSSSLRPRVASPPGRALCGLALAASVSLAAAPCALAAPAAAPPPPNDPTRQCRALLASFPLRQDGPVTVEAVGDDGCRFKGLRFGFGIRISYEVAELVEHGVPFGPPAAPTKFIHVRIEARGVAFVAHSGQAKLDWLVAQQQVPFDVVLDGSYDPARRRADLRELSLEGASVGRIALSGTVENVDRASFPTGAGLSALGLHLDSRRFITGFVLSSLLPFLPENDPDAAVAKGRRQGIAAARSLLPLGGASPTTVDAIAGFIADFPHPRHIFDLAITAPSPVTINVLEQASASLVAASALATTLKVTASYAGDPR